MDVGNLSKKKKNSIAKIGTAGAYSIGGVAEERDTHPLT